MHDETSSTRDPESDILAAYRVLARTADVRTTSHALLTSLPMWVSWVEANWALNLDGWWQHPALIIELDTAWRTWRNAWGPSGTDQARASWLYDWNTTLGRIVETPKTYMKMMTSSSFTPVFFTDAPGGTLGLLPDFPPQTVRSVDGITGEIINDVFSPGSSHVAGDHEC